MLQALTKDHHMSLICLKGPLSTMVAAGSQTSQAGWVLAQAYTLFSSSGKAGWPGVLKETTFKRHRAP